MSIVYLNEHTTCVNYEDANANINIKPLVEIAKLSKDMISEGVNSESIIILVMEGCFSISYEKQKDIPMNGGEMILLSPNSKYVLKSETDSSIVIFRLRGKKELCDRLGMEQLFNKYKSLEKDHKPLSLTKGFEYFLQGLKFYVSEGLLCHYYLELKVKEFFFLLRIYYTKETLADFFYPLLSNDNSFSDFVYNNYSKVKTVQELADLSNYSHSGFIKHFKKTFGMPAYQWMKQQKANRILHEINCSDKTLKQICDEYDFSSLSQFNDFCKSNFGSPPSHIKKNKVF